jgi:hypothetical protein
MAQKVYLLNAFALNMIQPPAIIKVTSISAEEAKELVRNRELVNAIGHEATAQIMGLLLGMELKANRIQVKMNAGDEAIILTLNKRLEEGQVIKDVNELSKIGYTLYHVSVSQ